MKKENRIDWNDIWATAVAVFAATVLKYYVFAQNWFAYSLWKDLLLFLACFIPVYALLRCMQRFLGNRKR